MVNKFENIKKRLCNLTIPRRSYITIEIIKTKERLARRLKAPMLQCVIKETWIKGGKNCNESKWKKSGDSGKNI